jgi:hypothetical protein
VIDNPGYYGVQTRYACRMTPTCNIRDALALITADNHALIS